MAGDGAQELAGPPVVLLVGDTTMGQKLLKVLGEVTASNDVAMGVIKNKYYSARVQYRAMAAAEASSANIQSAEAVVLLWDLQQREQLQEIKALFPAPSDEEEFDDGPDRVQICLAVGDATGAEVDRAREWCIDQGFEFLSCSLTDEDLEMLASRCQQTTGRRAGLLDEDLENSVLRLMEALECHSSWSSMEPIKAAPLAAPVAAEASRLPTTERKADEDRPAEDAARSGYAALPDAPEAPQGDEQTDSKNKPVQMEKVHDRIQDDDFAEADEFEKFAREMKETREMSDHQRRKDRACDLAMRLAASLGVDSDSD